MKYSVHYFAPPLSRSPAEHESPVASLLDALKAISHCGYLALKTRSKDIEDWKDDVFNMRNMANIAIDEYGSGGQDPEIAQETNDDSRR